MVNTSTNVRSVLKLAKTLEKAAEEFSKIRLLVKEGKASSYMLQFWKDWHTLANVSSIEEFLKITKGWKSKRRGEAFERWIHMFKQDGIKPPKVTFDSDVVKTELGVMLEKNSRIPDRFAPSSRAFWDFKHFEAETLVDPRQIEDYIKMMNASTSGFQVDRLVLLFSREDSAAKNLQKLNELKSGGKLPRLNEGKSIHVLFIDIKTGKIRRKGKIL